MPRLTRIAITAGDPCGIGPEVILKALARRTPRSNARPIILGDWAVFARAAARIRRRMPSWRVVPMSADAATLPIGTTPIFLDYGHTARFVPGRVSKQSGAASLAYLDGAIGLWRAGQIDALVTAPVTKWAIARTHPHFSGQTEYLASAMGRRNVVMLFVADQLRVAVLTRHIPLSRVPGAVTPKLLSTTLRLIGDALKRQFHIAHPRLALCGLNPHAGEEARCGREEQRVFLPILRALRRQGIRCDGPFAADGFFAQPVRHDAIICAYHDQGLIPFKMQARDRGCQMTVGLPIVRTSPDHGSAPDIAGKGIANPGSMIYALHLAEQLTTVTGKW